MNNIWHDISPKRISQEDFICVVEISKGSKKKDSTSFSEEWEEMNCFSDIPLGTSYQNRYSSAGTWNPSSLGIHLTKKESMSVSYYII